MHREILDEEGKSTKWVPQWSCSEVPVIELVGAGGGAILGIAIITIVTYIVYVNMKDLRDWKRYVAMKEANEARLDEAFNPLYEASVTTVENPMQYKIFDQK